MILADGVRAIDSSVPRRRDRGPKRLNVNGNRRKYGSAGGSGPLRSSGQQQHSSSSSCVRWPSVEECIQACSTYPPRYASLARGYRSYLRSNGVQLPTLLINPLPLPAGPSSLASILNPIVVRLSARDTCQGYPLQPAHLLLLLLPHLRRPPGTPLHRGSAFEISKVL